MIFTSHDNHVYFTNDDQYITYPLPFLELNVEYDVKVTRKEPSPKKNSIIMYGTVLQDDGHISCSGFRHCIKSCSFLKNDKVYIQIKKKKIKA